METPRPKYRIHLVLVWYEFLSGTEKGYSLSSTGQTQTDPLNPGDLFICNLFK